MLRCVVSNAKIFKFFVIIHDKMQERNTKERKDRIQVHPCVALRCDKRQSEGNATQALASYSEPDLYTAFLIEITLSRL